MALINITQLFDLSKAQATQAGQQLQDFLAYSTQALSQLISSLKNQLTFADNFNVDVKLLSVPADLPQVVSTPRGVPTGILPVRVMSTIYQLDAFGWWIDGSGRTIVKASFKGTPAPTGQVDIHVVIFYGRMVDGALTSKT